MVQSHRVAIAVAVVMLAPLTFLCATGASSASTSLSRELLTVAQMPIGWSINNSSLGSGVGCLGSTFEPRGSVQTAAAESNFQASGGIPAVDEMLASFTNAKAAFNIIAGNLLKCIDVSGKGSGYKVTGAMGEMSFPSYGDKSEAFSSSLTTQGTNLDEVTLVVREGVVVLGLSEAASKSVELNRFEGYVKLALEKITGVRPLVSGAPTTTTTQPTASARASISFFDQYGDPYRVAEIKLIDPAQGADQFMAPKAGFRFAAVVFRVTDTGRNQITDDANVDASVVGSNDHAYSADFDSVAQCTNFHEGEYSLTAGESAVGCVVFQLPIRVSVAMVDWSPSGGFGRSFGRWKVKN